MSELPLILDADTLAARRGDPGLRIVAVDAPADFRAAHIPGAVRVGYDEITRDAPPVKGLVPDPDALAAVFSRLGLHPDDHVVAYDRSGGGAAGRLLFTLDAAGHAGGLSLLDGGLQAWVAGGHETESGTVEPDATDYAVRPRSDCIADHDYIAGHLDDTGVKLLDTRSAPEYAGADVRAARGGHIPGAAHLEWTELKDDRDRLRPRHELLQRLAERGILPDDEVVVYCHSHHRSAHTYVALKALGFERVRGYPGAWSDWGNRTDTPVEET
ncbi:thiosulfate sulfurtransferase [Salinisphaera sp. PC39]|uniref:sulfurtransferase n=1 Tax=Salinisphaera sp. PC39 TaxID=1304156 RepID=UPI00333FA99C